MYPHPLKACIGIITAFLFASALVSCGNSAPSGYLATFTTAAIFIQWANTNGQLTGTFQEAYQDSNLNLKSVSEPVTGTLSGSTISLTLSVWGFPVQTYVGTLNADQLVLSFPQQNGTLQTVTFTPGTVDDYNKAVQSLATTLQNEQATATEQQVEASNAQATAQVAAAATATIADEQQQLAYDINNIDGVINSLKADGALSSLLNRYSDDIGSMQSAYHTEQSDASGGCTNYGQVGADLGQVGADQGQIGADYGQLQAQIPSVQNDIANVQDFVQEIQQHWNDLGQQPFSGVSASDVNNSLQSGNNAINQAKANIQSAQSQASGFDAQAKQIEQQAQALYNGMHC